MSLRNRLLVGMAVVALVLVTAAVAITRTTEDHLVGRVDAQLLAVPVVDQADGRGFGPPGFGGRRRGGAPFGLNLNSLYRGHVAGDGTLTTVDTPSDLSGGTPPLPEVPVEQVAAAGRDGRSYLFTVGSSDTDLRYRLLARPNTDRRFFDGEGTVVLALPLDDVDATVDRLVAVEAVTTLAVLGALGVVTWWVVRLGVRPIKRMTATATAIAGGDLSQRVPKVAPRTEAGELGTALNTMLGRIEEAFGERARSEARLRQFVADASHELRTPITTIRGYAELHRMGALEDPGERDSAMRRTEAEATRMGRLVEDLLLLARLDQGRPLERAPVDLGAIAADAASDARAVDPGRPVTARSDDGVGAVVGDEGRLRQVVANLVGNAMVHTPPGTPIALAVCRDGDRAVLEVSDDGPGMPDDVASRIFERFYRADPARSRHKGGSGLGLSIVKATVDAHGGAVSLRTAPGRGTTVRIELPAGA